MEVLSSTKPKEMIKTIATMGIDLAMNVFAVHAVGNSGLVELRQGQQTGFGTFVTFHKSM